MTTQEAQALNAMFTGMLEQEIATTRRVLAAVPETQLDFKLGEKGRTAGDLMWHLASSEAWFADGICRGDFGIPEPARPDETTVAALLAWYDRIVPALLARVKALSGEELARELNFFNVINQPAVMYLDFWKAHTIHHRGQLSTYLRAMNAHVPDIYGGSADEPFQMPAGA